MYYCPRCEKPSPTRNCPQCGGDLLPAGEKEYIERRYLDEQGLYSRREDGLVKLGGWFIVFIFWSVGGAIGSLAGIFYLEPAMLKIMSAVSMLVCLAAFLLFLLYSRKVILVLVVGATMMLALGIIYFLISGYFVVYGWFGMYLWALYFSRSKRASYALMPQQDAKNAQQLSPAEAGPYPRKPNGDVVLGGWFIAFMVWSVLQVIGSLVFFSNSVSIAPKGMAILTLAIGFVGFSLIVIRSRAVIYVLLAGASILLVWNVVYLGFNGSLATYSWIGMYPRALYFYKSKRASFTLPKRTARNKHT